MRKKVQLIITYKQPDVAPEDTSPTGQAHRKMTYCCGKMSNDSMYLETLKNIPSQVSLLLENINNN